ncbi:MAG: hypothetical protein Fur0037_00640 [Planctomycetota bacterium]
MVRPPRSRARAGAGRRSAARRRSSSGCDRAAVLIAAGAVAVVAVLVVALRRSDPPAPARPAAAAPESRSSPAPSRDASGAPGAEPRKPAPPLTDRDLAGLRKLLLEAKRLHNEGVLARSSGDNAGARAREGEARAILESWREGIADQLLWQEEAQMEGWRQPPSYSALERIFEEYQTLTKKVRMGGG